MATLKEIREIKGMTQAALSSKTNINIPVLSNYESGNIIPMLEDCINIERVFGTRLKWNEPITNKHSVVQCLITLMHNYPLLSVVNFASRWLKSDMKTETGISGIQHYAKQSEAFDEQPLYPEACQECE